jgi:hypothetical protein
VDQRPCGIQGEGGGVHGSVLPAVKRGEVK